MSDKLVQSQETNLELSEEDLDAVAGGSGYGGGYDKHYGGFAASIASANGAAVGEKFAFTENSTHTTAISTDYVQAALGSSNSTSVAAS
jgi:hypothetical protein